MEHSVEELTEEDVERGFTHCYVKETLLMVIQRRHHKRMLTSEKNRAEEDAYLRRKMEHKEDCLPKRRGGSRRLELTRDVKRVTFMTSWRQVLKSPKETAEATKEKRNRDSNPEHLQKQERLRRHGMSTNREKSLRDLKETWRRLVGKRNLEFQCLDAHARVV
ncbi:unnamed protein product [Microthlaspi erraticum]|uniref:Uncharacterized protein n=1 Tax=Microthlaspi erraticum TaxID=1685480 RepID=A0A6D2IGX2_9BRAS|nr:unnamed protein product [Microthlaspi erraticum]